jgi:hypothetical protein
MQSDAIRVSAKAAWTHEIGPSRTDCHAEGRGFKSHQPLLEKACNSAAFSVPSTHVETQNVKGQASGLLALASELIPAFSNR